MKISIFEKVRKISMSTGIILAFFAAFQSSASAGDSRSGSFTDKQGDRTFYFFQGPHNRKYGSLLFYIELRTFKISDFKAGALRLNVVDCGFEHEADMVSHKYLSSDLVKRHSPRELIDKFSGELYAGLAGDTSGNYLKEVQSRERFSSNLGAFIRRACSTRESRSSLEFPIASTVIETLSGDIWFLDMNSIHRRGGLVNFWWVQRYSKLEPSTQEERELRKGIIEDQQAIDFNRVPDPSRGYTRFLSSVDCKLRTLSNIQILEYNEFGRVLNSDSFPERSMDLQNQVAPGSVGAAALSWVCAAVAP